MQIKINKDGKVINYNSEKIKGRVYRNILVLKEELEDKLKNKEDFKLKDFDTTCNIIVEAFGNKFSYDDLIDSIDSADIMIYLTYILKEINNKSETKMKALADSL